MIRRTWRWHPQVSASPSQTTNGDDGPLIEDTEDTGRTFLVELRKLAEQVEALRTT